jgi:hypothetical protein
VGLGGARRSLRSAFWFASSSSFFAGWRALALVWRLIILNGGFGPLSMCMCAPRPRVAGGALEQPGLKPSEARE